MELPPVTDEMCAAAAAAWSPYCTWRQVIEAALAASSTEPLIETVSVPIPSNQVRYRCPHCSADGLTAPGADDAEKFIDNASPVAAVVVLDNAE